MAYGINFNSSTGARIMDGKHLIPQKIITYDCAGMAYSTGTDTDGTNCHPGFHLRQYNFNPSSAIYNRPHVVFWEMPDTQGYDIWMSSDDVFGCQILYPPSRVNNIVPPKAHVFALDYVTRSNASQGMRVWNPDTGALIFDSGNQHLNIYETFNVGVDTILNTDAPRSLVQSYQSPHSYFPWDTSNGQPGGISGPAFTLPNRYGSVEYANRFGNSYRWEYQFFYAITGMSFHTRCMRTSWGATGTDESNINYRYAPYVSGGNLSTQNIYGGYYR